LYFGGHISIFIYQQLGYCLKCEILEKCNWAVYRGLIAEPTFKLWLFFGEKTRVSLYELSCQLGIKQWSIINYIILQFWFN